MFFLVGHPKVSYNTDHEYQQLFEALADVGSTPVGFTLHNGLLFYKGHIFLNHSSSLKPLVLQHVHNSPCGGHSGYLKTLHWVRQDFFWKGMVKDVKLHVQCCEVCQRVKVSTSKLAGLLQPLPVPDKPWFDISMDFIEGLPKSHGYEVIFVVVDRLTKFPFHSFLSSLHSYKGGCSFYEKCV